MKTLAKGDQEVLLLLSEGVLDFEICRRLGMSEQALGRALKRINSRALLESDDVGRFYERALRRRAEAGLTSLTARFHALMDILPQAILVIEGRTGAIKDANEVACALFGFNREVLLAMSVEELVPEEYRPKHPAFRMAFLSSVRKREMGYHPPIYGIRADGSRIEMAIALTATTADNDVMVVCSEHAEWKVALDSKGEALAD